LHEFAKTERVLAEIEGIGLAVLSASLGYVARTVAGRFREHPEIERSPPQNDSQ